MARILYRLDGTHAPRGGHKVALRHIEALLENGFEACALLPDVGVVPGWFVHSAPVIRETDVQPADVIVVAEGNMHNLVNYAKTPNRKVVFCQNQFYAAAYGLAQLPPEILVRYDDYMACSETVARWLSRFVPSRSIEVVSAFADERRFQPKAKSNTIALMPSKRDLECTAISGMVKRLYRGPPWRVVAITGKTETEVASILAEAAIFVSLTRLDGLGMATLEAMASGCFVVGFKGIGGAEYATPVNGRWVDDDDCEACADGLMDAMALFTRDRPQFDRVVAAARGTADRYSHGGFVKQLCGFWDARVSRSSSAP